MLGTLKKINFLFTKRQRKGLVILAFLLFVGMFLEVLGLGVLIPAISIILDPNIIEQTPIINSVRNYFSHFSHQNFLFLFLGSIILVYLVKSLFIILLTYKQNRFLTSTVASISNNLFESYLSQPYNFHLNRNSSELIKNIHVEIKNFFTLLLSLMTILIEGGFVISILVTLIYIEPLGAISISFFYGLLSVFFIYVTKKKVKLWGALRIDLEAQVSKIAAESLGGIKDLIILGKSSFFIEQYSKKNFLAARLSANNGTLIHIPKIYLEFISVLGLVTFIILLIFKGVDNTSIFSILGVFVAAIFRMIPSLNRIIAALQSIKFYLPALNVVYNEISSCETNNSIQSSSANFIFSNEIEFKKLNFGFSENKMILCDINFKIKRGQTIGIVGESGSGKSTLVDLLIGLHKPSSGKILIDGLIDFQFSKAWRKSIGYVSQSIFLLNESIRSNIAFGIPIDQIDESQINKIIIKSQLEPFINSLPDGLDSKVGERGVQISGGQRQRIGIARALYHNPEILILDEATSALDSLTESKLMQTIDSLKGQMTIIMVAHRTSTLINCDYIYKIDERN